MLDDHGQQGRALTEWLARAPSVFFRQWSAFTVQGATVFALGMLFAFVVHVIGRPIAEFPLATLVGMALFVPVIGYLHSNPHWVLERKLKKCDKLCKAGLISKNKCLKWKNELLDAYHKEVLTARVEPDRLPLISVPREHTRTQAEASASVSGHK